MREEACRTGRTAANGSHFPSDPNLERYTRATSERGIGAKSHGFINNKLESKRIRTIHFKQTEQIVLSLTPRWRIGTPFSLGPCARLRPSCKTTRTPSTECVPHFLHSPLCPFENGDGEGKGRGEGGTNHNGVA